jgi:hypothetical protein
MKWNENCSECLKNKEGEVCSFPLESNPPDSGKHWKILDLSDVQREAEMIQAMRWGGGRARAAGGDKIAKHQNLSQISYSAHDNSVDLTRASSAPFSRRQTRSSFRPHARLRSCISINVTDGERKALDIFPVPGRKMERKGGISEEIRGWKRLLNSCHDSQATEKKLSYRTTTIWSFTTSHRKDTKNSWSAVLSEGENFLIPHVILTYISLGNHPSNMIPPPSSRPHRLFGCRGWLLAISIRQIFEFLISFLS